MCIHNFEQVAGFGSNSTHHVTLPPDTHYVRIFTVIRNRSTYVLFPSGNLFNQYLLLFVTATAAKVAMGDEKY